MVVPPTALDLLRKKLRKIRQTVAIERRNFTLQSNFILDDLLAVAQSVAYYRPMGGEPDPLPLLNKFAGVTALPALSTADPVMTFRRWSHRDPLVVSSWGGQQPADTATAIIPDLIFVPVLGFDDACNRIGQGGGHYDRYLAAHPHAARIGIAWEVQCVDRITAQPWDVPMDAILTETEFHVKDLTRCQRL
jgi:5-formyltetrahydrofolate cyclo-ligase